MPKEADRFAAETGRRPRMPFRVAPEKTFIPDAPGDALERTGLANRLDPVQRRLTVLLSPGGFGKTTLMAECCRRAESRGDKVMWLSVDEQDDGPRVVAHLAHAAGLEWIVGEHEASPEVDAEAQHLHALMARVRRDGSRWVLALDELERISESGAHIVDYLIRRGPANLHFAVACRNLPPSIDVATTLAEGLGIAVGPDELRFTRSELGSYFGGILPSQRLCALWDESLGWPIAACLQRNLSQAGQLDLSNLSANWVGTRLMRGLAEGDRRFVLEAGCLEWADAEFADEVLGFGATERLRRIGVLRGLLQGTKRGAVFRLHPIIRRYAEMELRLLGEGGKVHRRIAVAAAKRGKTVYAMRQAIAANDGVLAAEIFEAAGAVRLLFVDGLKGLQEAVAVLPQDVTAKFPRLELARAVASTLRDGISEPVGDDLSTPAGRRPADPTHVGNSDELRTDAIILRGASMIAGCMPVDSHQVRSTMKEVERAIVDPGLDPVVLGGFLYGQAWHRYTTGDLAAALVAAQRVRELAGACPGIALEARPLEGAILFARGDTRESETVLTRAQRDIQQHFAGHESPEVTCAVFAAEGALEANRLKAAGRRTISLAELARVRTWMDGLAAAVDIQVELALRRGAPAAALSTLQEADAFAANRRLPSLARWLTALRVSAFVRVGRVNDANRLWREAALPTKVEDLVDTENQSWREMEAVCSARVRLLTAAVGGNFGAAMTLGRSFHAHARDKGLTRSQSHAAALCMHVAWRAGATDAAQEFLIENLRIFQRTGFLRALTEQTETTAAVLRCLDADARELNAAKEAVLETVATTGGSSNEESQIDLTEREVEILARLADSQDAEIARALGLTASGVRYHIKKIYRKLGVANRREAVEDSRLLNLPLSVDG
ncbi:MAG: LuxR C-terminal-related transcriptional regulator [Gammaproteobacteria bacterium]|nr:LuxR C-terminal-related transcriptional regulator [Gammaproteobacteria bacterium]